jgi:hypothetical protein
VRRLGLLSIVVLLGAASAAQAANCPQTELSSAASQVQDARNALLGLPPPAEPLLAKKSAAAISDMKLKLAAFVLAYMHCQPENADVDGIGVDLTRLGWAQEAPPARGALFSGALAFEARSPQPGMIAVTARFGIGCGSDTMLLLFEHADAGWTETLQVASPAYRDMAQAYQDLDYAVAPPDSDGSWYLVEKHRPASCAPARAQGISYSVLRPSRDPAKPKLLYAGHDAGLGADTQIDAAADSFALTASGDAPHRFAVAGQTVTPQ